MYSSHHPSNVFGYNLLRQSSTVGYSIVGFRSPRAERLQRRVPEFVGSGSVPTEAGRSGPTFPSVGDDGAFETLEYVYGVEGEVGPVLHSAHRR